MSEHEAWTDKLSDYLDGELTPEEQYAVESHLHGCAACAAVLEDLGRVVTRARTIEPRPPQTNLWSGIAARIDADGRAPKAAPFRARTPRRFTFTLPQLAAATLLIAAISGAFVWSFVNRSRSADVSRSAPPIERLPERESLEPVGLADNAYDAAVTDLERALKQGRGRLDAATIATVEHNLQTIDEAIRQAREALAADPANTYLSGHLVEARRRKLDLLRRATELTSEMN